jgi:Protein of unknown function (DUF2690)
MTGHERQQMRKVITTAIAVTAVSPFLLLGAAQSANAATSCYASTCTGQPAAGTTCVNDAKLIYQYDIYTSSGTVVGNIELKYSPSCRASWARVISNLSQGAAGFIYSSKSGLDEVCYGSNGPGTGCNTDMIDDLNPLTSFAEGWVYYNDNEYWQNNTPSY